MQDPTFKYHAIRHIDSIFGQAKQLEDEAKSDIHADLAIETRDLMVDIISAIGRWKKQNASVLLPKADAE